MNDPTMDESVFCAQLSRALHEPMIGTATRVDVWFLLSYSAVWEAKATENNDLPAEIQAWLDAQLATIPLSRLQFIRQRDGVTEVGETFFIGVAREDDQRLYRFPLRDYSDLLELDVAAIVAHDPVYAPARIPGSLYLVCTNGRRDRCCALYGVAAYDALRAVAGAAVWQTTHTGGHRFAPTLLTLPDGTLSGRLAPDEAPGFAAVRQEGKLSLSHLRGRAYYDELVQAADGLLRRETGELELDAYRLAEVEPVPDNIWRVVFVAQGTGALHRLFVERSPSSLPIYASCGKPQRKPGYEYALRAHEIRPAS